MRIGQGVRTGLGHGGITCVLQTQFSSCTYFRYKTCSEKIKTATPKSNLMPHSVFKFFLQDKETSACNT